jgi:hypothetical protein
LDDHVEASSFERLVNFWLYIEKAFAVVLEEARRDWNKSCRLELLSFAFFFLLLLLHDTLRLKTLHHILAIVHASQAFQVLSDHDARLAASHFT